MHQYNYNTRNKTKRRGVIFPIGRSPTRKNKISLMSNDLDNLESRLKQIEQSKSKSNSSLLMPMQKSKSPQIGQTNWDELYRSHVRKSIEFSPNRHIYESPMQMSPITIHYDRRPSPFKPKMHDAISKLSQNAYRTRRNEKQAILIPAKRVSRERTRTPVNNKTSSPKRQLRPRQIIHRRVKYIEEY